MKLYVCATIPISPVSSYIGHSSSKSSRGIISSSMHRTPLCLNMSQHTSFVSQVSGAESRLQHGYIGLTFGTYSESFFASALKVSPRFIQVGFSALGWPTSFFIALITSLAITANAMSSRGFLIMVLDYKADLFPLLLEA